jgi:AcrR family transcriptional regulator
MTAYVYHVSMPGRQPPDPSKSASAAAISSAKGPTSSKGREAQRRRTRRTLIEATQRLVAAGGPPPTIDAIAAAADVSRRTVYTHFPTLDQLLLDAALGALSEAYVDTALETANEHVGRQGDDVPARVDALVTALLDLGESTLPLGRQIIRLTVASEPYDEQGHPVPRRGSRRASWIEAAIAPLTPALSPEQHERLVSSLSMVIGFESMIVLRDIRGLDPISEATINRWAARALVDAMLAELDRT